LNLKRDHRASLRLAVYTARAEPECSTRKITIENNSSLAVRHDHLPFFFSSLKNATPTIKPWRFFSVLLDLATAMILNFDLRKQFEVL
jgi:hypothetical protein